ncbi:predicted protein [Chaetoceros tenuissimus]|uniref:Uncharacterized protein n=1 Tax=Chaetoceros tenuissimus TaxID=426638 RepID=A0AAD3GZ10_9STRA|nr:predicted protein [Chaetoceros tenuissimus]
MSDTESNETSFLDIIGRMEDELSQIKTLILEGSRTELENAVLCEKCWLQIEGMVSEMQHKIGEISNDYHESLRNFLLTTQSEEYPRDDFWLKFENKLNEIGDDVECRKKALEHYDSTDGKRLIHHVCSMNPPVSTLELLVELTSFPDPDYYEKYNHLSEAGDGEYPVHILLQNGASFDNVKFLLEKDTSKETLNNFRPGSISTVGTLILHKDSYDDFNEYMKILKYTVQQSADDDSYKEILFHRNVKEEKKSLPIHLCWEKYKEEGFLDSDIIEKEDIQYLLKAMCYYADVRKEKCNRAYTKVKEGEEENTIKSIEDISLLEALLRSSQCFDMPIIENVLSKLLNGDNEHRDCREYLFTKDSEGKYPIFRLLQYSDYSIFPDWSLNFLEFPRMIRTLLKFAPDLSQIKDDEGFLLLHIVSDSRLLTYLGRIRRELVEMIVKANLDAVSTIDGRTGLLPFMLAVRGAPEYWLNQKTEKTTKYDFPEVDFEEDFNCNLSASYLLLRQCPDVIQVSSKSIERSKKRQKIEKDASK